MKFLEFLLQNQIKEWKDFYINYNLLKKILKPIQSLYKLKLRKNYLKEISEQNKGDNFKNQLQNLDIEIDYLENKMDINKIHTSFCNQMIIETKKFLFFYKESLDKNVERLTEIKEQINYAKKTFCFPTYEKIFEIYLKVLYKEFSLLREFMELNFQAKNKILKKYKKFFKLLNNDINKNFPVFQIDVNLDKLFEETGVTEFEKIIDLHITKIKKYFNSNYSNKYKDNTINYLKSEVSEKETSLLTCFYIGFLIGLIILFSSIILCVHYSYKDHFLLDLNYKKIYPVYRMMFCLIFYFFVICLNIFIWKKNNFPYHLLFNFSNLNLFFNEIFTLMNKAVFMIVIMLLFYMYYLLNHLNLNPSYLLFFSNNYIPLICMIFIIIYMFYDINFSSFINVFDLKSFEFKNVFYTNQLISLIGPMRGIFYTLCYYTFYTETFTYIDNYCTMEGNIFYLLITLYPITVRIYQCFNIIKIDINNQESKIYQMFKIAKYFGYILIILFSFFYPISGYSISVLIIWSILYVVLSLFSIFCDLDIDFQLLKKNQNLLRKKLFYNKNNYYFYMGTDIILRFVFIFTLCPEVILHFFNDFLHSVLTTIYILEIFRRFIWNLIRVEVKCIQISKKYILFNNIELPFKRNEEDENKFELRSKILVDKEQINFSNIEYISDTGIIKFNQESNDVYENIFITYLNENYILKTKQNLKKDLDRLKNIYLVENNTL